MVASTGSQSDDFTSQIRAIDQDPPFVDCVETAGVAWLIYWNIFFTSI